MKDALSILRVQVFDDTSNEWWLKGAPLSWVSPRKNHIMPLSARHELRAILALKKLVEIKLSKFTYTLSGGSALIETVGEEMSERSQLAI